jgi:hypothetical protein
MSSVPPLAVPAPHSFGLFGEGAVTLPPVPPPGVSAALSSSKSVCGQSLSSTTIVQS